MKVFVTGGCGWLGSWITNALLAEGHQVTVYDLSPAPKPVWPSITGAKVVVGDVLDKETLMGAMEGTEVVVHIAAYVKMGISEPRDWPKFQKINLDGTRSVLQAAIAVDAKGFVFTSSLSSLFSGKGPVVRATEEWPVPKVWSDHYAKSKALSEKIVMEECGDLPVVSLRPSVILGPHAHGWHSMYMWGKPNIAAAGREPLIDWVEVRSVASAHVLAVDKIAVENSPIAGKVYNLAAEEPMGHAELYLKICKACDTKPGTLMRPTVAWIALNVMNIPNRLFGVGQLGTGPSLVDYTWYEFTFDCSAAKRELGWTQAQSMDDAIEEFAEAVKADKAERQARKKSGKK